MFQGRFPLAYLVFALLDYTFKAVVNYRNTAEGASEWADVEAAAQDVMGDTEGADETRTETQAQRNRLSTPGTQSVTGRRGNRYEQHNPDQSTEG